MTEDQFRNIILRLQIENEKLRNKIDDLTGDWDYLECLSPTENFIVNVLVARSPRPISTRSLCHLIEEEFDSDASIKTRKKQMFDIRKKLKPYNIHINHIWDAGYFIDAENKQRVLKLMRGELAA